MDEVIMLIPLAVFCAQLEAALEEQETWRAATFAVFQFEVGEEVFHVVAYPHLARCAVGPWSSDPDVLVTVNEPAVFQSLAGAPETLPLVVAAGQATMGDSAAPDAHWPNVQMMLTWRRAWAIEHPNV